MSDGISDFDPIPQKTKAFRRETAAHQMDAHEARQGS
jgi:hypothetical protein